MSAKHKAYEADFDATGDQLLRSPMITRALRDIGDDIETAARALAPVDTGHYRDSFSTEVELHRKKKRLMARVSNSADYSFALEYGTGDTPAFRVLRRAVEAGRRS